ncbi:DUF4389 domain-containing protein [Thiomicrorhabdus arctica]|uniref:DUF4389 domain-containing protein n=1 Tax=Thiomicrorhabdus arctica TaxID=131540 RepID=UPI00036CDA6E|nr:DUF4389 domain-containing protein [Thiomicrorhabdus arctica]
MKDDTVKSYKDKSVWMRGLYMLMFIILLGVAKFVSFVVILIQFLTVLFTAETNLKLVQFGKSLSLYQYEIMLFLTYNSDAHPYPMGEWPEVTEVTEVAETTEKNKG